MSKHTPGPWKFVPRESEFHRYGGIFADGHMRPLALITKLADCEANARLIAAAPDLLQQLRLARMIIAKHDPLAPDLIAIDYAIAKAEGR